MRKRKTPTSGCRGDFWLKGVFLILACDDTIFKIRVHQFFSKNYNLAFLVSVLLSASVERFSVSRMRDFFFFFIIYQKQLFLPWYFDLFVYKHLNIFSNDKLSSNQLASSCFKKNPPLPRYFCRAWFSIILELFLNPCPETVGAGEDVLLVDFFWQLV